MIMALTIDVRKIVDAYSGHTWGDGKNPWEYVQDALPHIFDFPINVDTWDNAQVMEEKRKTQAEIDEINNSVKLEIETAIINHYLPYIIAFESVGLWKQQMYSRFLDIMPGYNQKFKIISDKYEWRTFHDYEIYRDENRQDNGITNSVNTSTGNTTTLVGDYPTTGNTDAYASAKTEVTASANETNTDENSNTGTIHAEEYRIGATGKTPMNLQAEALSVVQNLILEIVEEFKDLFYYEVQLEGGWNI